ncbi:MAG: hypothetical protein KDN19_03785 [Verrucomicrobiae bacterium]|nr:hypothetical protein [Verrucomicrobiae bacterium]
MESSPAIPFKGQKIPVAISIKGGFAVQFSISVGTTDSQTEAADLARQLLEFLYRYYEMEMPEQIQNLDINAALSEQKSTYEFPMPEFSNRQVWIGHSTDKYSVLLQVRSDEPGTGVPGKAEPSQDFPEIGVEPPEMVQAETDPQRVEKVGGNISFKRSLATIHALLVREIEDGKHAAQAMPLTATATLDRTDGKIGFQFNQEVGPEMTRALAEVVRATQIRHQILPTNQEVQFGFADKWTGKDGPSAAVATALLLESLFEGFEIPENVAVTGDLNADQKVQPIGGVPDKIRGAMAEGCSVIGIPVANEVDIDDFVVEEKLRAFLTARVFLLDSLDDAVRLVNPDARSPEYSQALTSFDSIQSDLAQGGAKALFAPEMAQRLRLVLNGAPNLYSAKILLAAAENRLPAHFSLSGTLIRLHEAMAPYADFAGRIRSGESIETFQLGKDDALNETQNRLRALRSQSDPRLVQVISNQEVVLDRLQRFINSSDRNERVVQGHLDEIKAVSTRASEEWKRMLGNQEIQDQLMARGINLH